MISKTFIIAEAGVNHNGDIEIAKKLVDAAYEAGADAVKFQTFKTELLVTKTAKKAEYQKKTTDAEEGQFEMIKRLELDRASHEVLIDYCREKNIEFLSSPFDLESIDLLNNLGMRLLKIPSGEITNFPYLKKIAESGKNVILSTGMANLEEVAAAFDVLLKYGLNKDQITVLHCNTEYPTPMKDVNLRAMATLKDKLQVAVGYSDHTLGIEVPLAAVALGASVIEKHFTLDQMMPGPDHKASLNPVQLKKMVQGIRNVEKAMGHGQKIPSESELKNKNIVRKSLVAKTKILKGEIFSEKNLTAKRPGEGINPMDWPKFMGKISSHNYEEDEIIKI